MEPSRNVFSDPAERRKLIRFSACSVAFITMPLTAFVVLSAFLIVKPLQGIAPESGSFQSDVSIAVEIVAVDPISRTIMMDWYPRPKVDCSKDHRVVDIQIDESLLDSTNPIVSSQNPYLSLFRLNTTEFCLGLIVTPNRSFRTSTKLLSEAASVPVLPLTGRSTLQNYPFDVYVASITLSVHNVETGEIYAPQITNFYGIAVNFKMSLEKSLVLPTNTGNFRASRLALAFRIERSKATKMFVVMVAITNWLTASAFLIICAAATVYHSHQIYSEMFVVPVGALFAFTSIRTNLPGAPTDFGTNLDMYSTLPALVIMSSCSFALLLIILYRRIQDNILGSRQKDTDKNQSERVDIEKLDNSSSLHGFHTRHLTCEGLSSSGLGPSAPGSTTEAGDGDGDGDVAAHAQVNYSA